MADAFDPFGPFNVFGAGGTYDPALGMVLAQNPESVANAAAAAGIPPPQPQVANVPPLGQSMDPTAEERPAASTATSAQPAESTDVSAQRRNVPSLAQTLRGVAPPAQPQIQSIRTPTVPQPHGNIQQGQLLQLLLAQQQPQVPNVSLFGRPLR